MSRTAKDSPVINHLRTKDKDFRKSYLQYLNPRKKHIDFEDDEESSLCTVCDSELSSTGNTHFCENCGWNNAQSLIDNFDSDFDDAA